MEGSRRRPEALDMRSHPDTIRSTVHRLSLLLPGLLALACGGEPGSFAPISAEVLALVAIEDCDSGSEGV